MSWIESEHFDVECPHCGNEKQECAEFNMDEMDRGGGKSRLHKAECQECYKEFWFNATMTIEFECYDVHKKKPKDSK